MGETQDYSITDSVVFNLPKSIKVRPKPNSCKLKYDIINFERCQQILLGKTPKPTPKITEPRENLKLHKIIVLKFMLHPITPEQPSV